MKNKLIFEWGKRLFNKKTYGNTEWKKKKVRKSWNTQEIAKLDGLKEEVQDIQKQI